MKETNKTISIDAILWDFDGTLANSAAKNIAITRQILARVAPQLSGANLPRALQSEADYHHANHSVEHWRDLYRDHFGMTPGEIDIAGPMWETYQARDNTEVGLFEGVVETVTQLSGLPQGICSANSTGNIRQVLTRHGINSAFHSVIGYEDLPYHHQKPAAEGGLKCLSEIFQSAYVASGPAELVQPKTVIYVGDHIADVIFSRGLNQILGPESTVISVIVKYSGANPDTWTARPDMVIDSPAELLSFIESY